jgi:Uma2 family endonuclease
MNDMKVRVEAANCFYYPDVMVTCEPLEPRSVYINKPVLIIEVLSQSTAQIDRREKLVAYKKLSSLQEYVIVHQNKQLVEVHRKQSNGRWMVSVLRQSERLNLESIPNKPFSLPVSAIYKGLDLSAFVEESEEEYSIG